MAEPQLLTMKPKEDKIWLIHIYKQLSICIVLIVRDEL